MHHLPLAMKFVILSLVVGAAAARGYGGLTHARGRVLSEAEQDVSFRNGQPASAAYTAGGTSKPCTGLYCQDNPLGNPCPCPVVKPCRHQNDGHCMNRVNIMGRYSPCSYHIPGVWSAEMAGMINLGQKKAGGCMCTAGTEDVYTSEKWGNCDPKNPKWCDIKGNGNACPENPNTATGAKKTGFKPKCASQDSTFSNKQVEAMNLRMMANAMRLQAKNAPAMPVQQPSADVPTCAKGTNYP